MEKRFFFYGTLSHEVVNDVTMSLHNKLQFEGKGFVVGRLFALVHESAYYPAFVLDESGYRVYGNIYSTKENFSDTDLKILDEYEEFYPENVVRSEYIRQKVLINTGKEKLPVDVYSYNKTIPIDAVEVTYGDFIKFVRAI
jgi:pyruvate carboxylase